MQSQVERWESTAGVAAPLGRPARPGKGGSARAARAQQQHPAAFAERGGGDPGFELVDQAKRADHGGRVDIGAHALVVEADVAANHRDTERLARLGHAIDGFRELPHHCGALRVAEVQAVDQCNRPRTRAGDIEGRFRHYEAGPCTRVESAPAGVPVGGERNRAGGGPCRRANTRGREPEHCRIRSRRNDRVAEQLVVVLAERPGGVDKHRQEILDQFFRRSWA